MLPLRTITLSLWFLPRLSLNHCGYRQISSKFSPWRKMREDKKSRKSSQAGRLQVGGNSAVDKGTVVPDGSLSDTMYDNEGYMMVGSNPIPLRHKNLQNHYPLSTRCKSSIDEHLDPMAMSDHLLSPSTAIASENTTVKRRTRIDLQLAQTSGDSYGGSTFGSGYENNSLSFTHTLPTTKFASPYDKSLRSSHFGKRKVASANRPHAGHSHLNNTAAGQQLDFSVSLPKFKPYDICRPGKQNSALIGATPLEVNKESCIEMLAGGTKERILRPGMVLLKHYLSHNEQVQIVRICQELGLGPGGFYQPGYADGAKLRLQMMCLGLDWDPRTRKYGNKRLVDGSKPPGIPSHFHKLVRRAIREAHDLINKECGVSNAEDILPSLSSDVCIVNFYTNKGRLGLHQDRDESSESLRKGLPVVSFSIGDSAEFLYGDQRDVEKAEKVLLESGDVLIFGGESRHVFHGVSSIIPNSAPEVLLKDTGLISGRLNLTFRQY